MEKKYKFDNEQEKNKYNTNNAKCDFIYKAGSIFFFILLLCSSIYEIKFRFQRTNTGLQYKIIKKTNKEQVDEKMGFRIEREISCNGKILEYRNQYGYSPLLFMKKNIMKNDFDGKYFEAVNLLKPGEIFIFKLKARNIPISYGMNPINVEKNQNVLVKIELVDVFTREEGQKKVMVFFEERKKDADKILEQQNKKIEDFLNKNKFKFEKKEKYYVVYEEEHKNIIKVGDKVKINFSIKEDNGKFIATNIKEKAIKEKIFNEEAKYEPISITINESTDWIMDCLKNLQKGKKCKVFLPTVDVSNLDCSKNFFEVELEVLEIEEKKEEVKKNETTVGENEEKDKKVKKNETTVGENEEKDKKVKENKTTVGENEKKDKKVNTVYKKNKKNTVEKKNIKKR